MQTERIFFLSVDVLDPSSCGFVLCQSPASGDSTLAILFKGLETPKLWICRTPTFPKNVFEKDLCSKVRRELM